MNRRASRPRRCVTARSLASSAISSFPGELPCMSASAWPSPTARSAKPPRLAPDGTALHFIHGAQDPVIAPAFSVAAAERLRALGATARVDLLPGLGHGIDGRVLTLLSAALDPDLEA